MKTTVTVLLLTVLMAPLTMTQTKVVSFKKLQEFLPAAALKGFDRKKPTGQTQSAMGMTTSEAKVRYVQPPDTSGKEEYVPLQSVEITISDMAGIPYGQMAAMQYNQDFENETEDGYEKSVVIKGYRGKEAARTGDSKSCNLEFVVGNRFIVKLEGDNFSDTATLHTLIDSMDLAKLEKAESK